MCSSRISSRSAWFSSRVNFSHACSRRQSRRDARLPLVKRRSDCSSTSSNDYRNAHVCWKGYLKGECMPLPSSDPEKSGGYFLPPENIAELARLLNQDATITQGMGGLLAERGQDVSGIASVLDLACGPGGWPMDFARRYPHIEVYGVDISH